MTPTIQTAFKRIETKYILSKETFHHLLNDLKHYLEEDDFPTSTIRNIYFDTAHFDLIKDALVGKHLREKIRMRSYHQKPTQHSQAFLEVKQKDSLGVGHKHRLVATPAIITKLLASQEVTSTIDNKHLLQALHDIKHRHGELEPRVYIAYDRYSLKQQSHLTDKVRITFDTNLRYSSNVNDIEHIGQTKELLDKEHIIMEIKAGEQKPIWLQNLLDKYGLVQMKFSKYAAAYHATEGLAYSPRPALLTAKGGEYA